MTKSIALIADRVAGLHDAIADRWREAAASANEGQFAPNLKSSATTLLDRELRDHLPLLTDRLAGLLRGQPAPDLDAQSRRHGRQRQREGHSLTEVLWEFSVLRTVLMAIIDNAAAQGVAPTDLPQARRIILGALDHCARSASEQFTVEAERTQAATLAEVRRLQQQSRHLRDTLSHELRNQISPILLNVQLAQRATAADPQAHRALEAVERQARNQAELINQLLQPTTDLWQVVARAPSSNLQPNPSAAATVVEETGKDEDARKDGAPRVGCPCLLVVDDNPDQLEALSQVLAMRGFNPVTAATGADALVLAAKVKPFAAIIDIAMPGMDGYEVARRLRLLGELEHMVLIALSGFGSSEHFAWSRAAGFHHHLVKPVDLAKLESLLRPG